MKITRNGFIAIAAFLLLAGTSFAQEQGAPSKQRQASEWIRSMFKRCPWTA